MTDDRHYRLRAGVTLPHAEWLTPGVTYRGRRVQDPRGREQGLVQLFHPSDPTESEILPAHLLEEVAS